MPRIAPCATRCWPPLLDLRSAEALGALRRALEQRLVGICRRILLMLSFAHDATTIKRAGERFRTGTPEQRAYAWRSSTRISPET